MNEDKPLRLYYDDFNYDGRLDILETYFDTATDAYVPVKRLNEFKSMSSLMGGVSSHREYATSSLEKIFRSDFNTVPFKEINTLQSMVFLNLPDGFKPLPLPNEAQFSASFAAAVTDFDNDGNEDIFLSQNTFSGPPNRPRIDGGRGLLLRGNGEGGFQAIPGHNSGIEVYGAQRGAALSDFNKDGKTDLAVTQNGGKTKLYINQTDNRGIRVHLKGPLPNEDAIGAAVRIVYASGRRGPVREIQAGSGYSSQNSNTLVMGLSSSDAIAIEITWPGGKKQRVGIVEEKFSYDITY